MTRIKLRPWVRVEKCCECINEDLWGVMPFWLTGSKEGAGKVERKGYKNVKPRQMDQMNAVKMEQIVLQIGEGPRILIHGEKRLDENLVKIDCYFGERKV